MTLGQRIAQKRRELGLSQEQLGQEMGVSRQAIYKWESDATVPEIDKLIALSRRFGVSVGWLLGEEESAEAQEPGGEPLTEEQIRLIQQLVAAYQPPRSKKRHRAVWAACTTVALLVVLLIVALSRLSDLSSRYDYLYHQLDDIRRNYTDFNLQLSDITDRVQEAMEQQADLTAARQVRLESYDAASGTVTFRLSATPKTYTEGMRASFIALSDGQTVEVEAQGQQSFEGKITCPLSDQISLLVAFVDGESRSTQLLETIPDLYRRTLPSLSLDFPCLSYRQDKDQFSLRQGDTEAVLFVENDPGADEYGLSQADVKSIRVGLFQEQRLLCWMERTEDISYRDGHCFLLPRDIPLTEGGQYRLAAVLTDSYGRELLYSGQIWIRDSSAEGLLDTAEGEGYQNPADWSY